MPLPTDVLREKNTSTEREEIKRRWDKKRREIKTKIKMEVTERREKKCTSVTVAETSVVSIVPQTKDNAPYDHSGCHKLLHKAIPPHHHTPSGRVPQRNMETERYRDNFTCYQSSLVQALRRSQLQEDRAEDHHEIINDEDTPPGAYDQFSYLGRGQNVPKSH